MKGKIVIIDLIVWLLSCAMVYYCLKGPLGEDAGWATIGIMIGTSFYAKWERFRSDISK